MPEHAATRLLIVDADGDRRAALAAALAQGGFVNVAGTGDPAYAQDLCAAGGADLVLLDLDMPAPLALLRSLTGPPCDALVIVLAGNASPDTRRDALAAGIQDLVTRPVDEAELLFRVRHALRARRLQQQLEDRDAILTDTLRERKSELETTRESLSVLTVIAEYHDDDTHQHAQRVGIGASLIAQALELPEPFVAMIRDAAPLHDIGKVGISRRILLKPDRLTPAEWMHMMRHVEIGGRILAAAQSPVLRLAAEIARTHHERWDGNGYLDGLSGEDIPIAGRITAVADVWDTLTHQRPYKQAWDEDRALAEISAQSGAHFDPRIVQAFSTIDWPHLNAILSSELAQQLAV